MEENFPFMLPINIRCNSCSQYIYQVTDLFVRKEEVLDEKYPDFESCQVCLKCRNCPAKIWIRSNPANRDYAVVLQCRKNGKGKLKSEEGGEALKSLEKTTLGSKREIAALDEMKPVESQHATVSADTTLEDSPTKVAKRV
nr:coiled-coil domain-containing protein 94 homolog [Quercus suber]